MYRKPHAKACFFCFLASGVPLKFAAQLLLSGKEATWTWLGLVWGSSKNHEHQNSNAGFLGAYFRHSQKTLERYYIPCTCTLKHLQMTQAGSNLLNCQAILSCLEEDLQEVLSDLPSRIESVLVWYGAQLNCRAFGIGIISLYRIGIKVRQFEGSSLHSGFLFEASLWRARWFGNWRSRRCGFAFVFRLRRRDWDWADCGSLCAREAGTGSRGTHAGASKSVARSTWRQCAIASFWTQAGCQNATPLAAMEIHYSCYGDSMASHACHSVTRAKSFQASSTTNAAQGIPASGFAFRAHAWGKLAKVRSQTLGLALWLRVERALIFADFFFLRGGSSIPRNHRGCACMFGAPVASLPWLEPFVTDSERPWREWTDIAWQNWFQDVWDKSVTQLIFQFIPQRVCSSVKSRQKFLSKVAFQDTGGICKKKNKIQIAVATLLS